MKPEWSGHPEVGPMFLTIGISAVVVLLMLIWLFAFYW